MPRCEGCGDRGSTLKYGELSASLGLEEPWSQFQASNLTSPVFVINTKNKTHFVAVPFSRHSKYYPKHFASYDTVRRHPRPPALRLVQ